MGDSKRDNQRGYDRSLGCLHTLRQGARHIVLSTLGSVARPAPGIHILNGHRTRGEAEPETFRRLLTRLQGHVRFIRVEEAVARIEAGDRPAEPLVAFTFDDGFTECRDVFAPVLEEFGVNALFFVNPNFVEGDEAYIRHFCADTVLTPGKRPMRWDDLRRLAARGHIIGAHTMDHHMIARGDDDTLRYQIQHCREAVEQAMGQPCEYFAFPYGRLTHASAHAIDMACATYPHVFSQSDYRHYFSFGGRVINRRHFEPFWPASHVRYFLSARKQ